MLNYKNRLVFTGGSGRFAGSFKAQEAKTNLKFFFPKNNEYTQQRYRSEH